MDLCGLSGNCSFLKKLKEEDTRNICEDVKKGWSSKASGRGGGVFGVG